MTKLTASLFFYFLITASYGQERFTSRINSLYTAGQAVDSTQRVTAIDLIWRQLQTDQSIPLISDDSVAFLYRGLAKSVAWTGDFNGWGYLSKFPNKGALIPGTDIWIMKASFPKDTRLDYKILLDGVQWILDPENPHQQWSGVGGGSPNSQLQMPDWKQDPILLPRADIGHGKVIEDVLFNSKILGYQLTYSVYIPAHSEDLGKVQSLYVTDGYEYMQPRLGNMVTVLDNLLADKKIKPLIVIFIDHREPVNRANNKRMDELSMNPRYMDFFVKEFIPFIEGHYPVLRESEARGIMGTSMGGLTAAYFSFSQPGIFGKAGIQSPAFAVRPQIYALCNTPQHPMKVSMTSGLLSDSNEASQKMQGILKNNACEYHYHEVNDGHSWGNWRNLIDDVLIDLYGN